MFGRRFARAFFRGPWEGSPWYGPQGPWGEARRWHTPEQQALRSTAGEVGRLFFIANRSTINNPEQQAKLRAFLERSRQELMEIISEASQTTGGQR